MIDKFSKERFEKALAAIHPDWQPLEQQGQSRQDEECYIIPVNANARIRVNSSIDSTGFAAKSGKDSIRIWVEVYQPNWKRPSQMIWQAAGKKVDAYTKRTPGWDKRMEVKIRELWNRAARVVRPVNTCSKCGAAGFAAFVKKEGKNKNRPFFSHRDCKGSFEWLDTPYKPGEIVHADDSSIHLCDAGKGDEVAPVQNGRSSEKSVRKVNSTAKREKPSKFSPRGSERSPSFDDLPGMPEEVEDTKIDAEISSFKQGLRNRKKQAGKRATKAQQTAIDLPAGTNFGLMAPPGSGKTYVVENRYAHLVADQNIHPDNILVVTLSKKMATEMLERIKAACPRAKQDQISTIHALCYRLLTRWDKDSRFSNWQVPKDWEVKKVVDDLVKKYWRVSEDEDKPTYSEILTWVDNSKYHGLTIEESEAYFVKNLGVEFGMWLHSIRRDLDSWLENKKFLRFADMLYHTEKQLQHNSTFRSRWQSQFAEVIVDEGQDTNYQAMRILITLSLDPGQNAVYDSYQYKVPELQF